jgi:hypothetical protein
MCKNPLFTPVDNAVDTITRGGKPPQRLRLRRRGPKKDGYQREVAERVNIETRAIPNNAWARSIRRLSIARNFYPHLMQFGCGYVHRKNAQSLKE